MAQPIRLASLVVYNSTLGPKEGEEIKKLLFYYPDIETRNRKVNNVGLYEALVQFTRTLSPENSCEFLHTQNHHYFFHEPEEDFWIVIALANPTIINSSGKHETKEHAINDSVYQTILKDIYRRFRFLHGTFLNLQKNFGIDYLKTKLSNFFTELLPVLKFSNCDLLNIFNGVNYSKVDKSNILAFQSFINLVQDKYKNIKYSLLMCDRNLILTNLSKLDSQILISLLREKLLLDLPFSMRFKASAKAVTIYQLSHGRFASNLLASTNNTVFISMKDKSMEQMHILVYQAFSITACFLLDYLDISLIDMCKSLDPIIGPNIVNLAKGLPSSAHSGNHENIDPNIRHVLFDQETLAIQTSCHTTQNGKTVCAVPREIMQVLNDVAGSRDEKRYQDEEIINKAHNEHWIATKKTNQKELYVIVHSKNANLIAINDDIRRMSFHFDNICFSD